MGMHSSTSTTDRLRGIIATLGRFYEIRYRELSGQVERFSGGFDPKADEYSTSPKDAPYYAYMTELSNGIQPVLDKLGVKLDPVPPGDPRRGRDELVMGGAILLKWDVDVTDTTSGEYIGRLEWSICRRHDRFAVPGPPKLSYLKARGGRTVMVS